MKPTLTLILILFALSVEAQAPIQATRLTIVNDSARVDVGNELQEAQREIEAIKEYDKKILTNLKSIRADLDAIQYQVKATPKKHDKVTVSVGELESKKGTMIVNKNELCIGIVFLMLLSFVMGIIAVKW